MNEYKITYEDGDYLFTRFNGNIIEAKNYYLGHSFTYWDATECKEKDRKVIKIEQLNN